MFLWLFNVFFARAVGQTPDKIIEKGARDEKVGSEVLNKEYVQMKQR